MPSAEPFLRNRLRPYGIEIDYLRLRCGRDEEFFTAWAAQPDPPSLAMGSLAEWDAVLLRRRTELYPRHRTDVLTSPRFARCVTGRAGYFTYQWDHPINEDITPDWLGGQSGCRGAIVSLRFHDRVRAHLGLAAEMFLCDALQARPAPPGLRLAVLHSLGWYDATVLLFAEPGREGELITTSRWLKHLSLSTLLGSRHDVLAADRAAGDRSVLSASYVQLTVPCEDGASAWDPAFTAQVAETKVLIRAEPSAGERILHGLRAAGGQTAGLSLGEEHGRYAFSMDATACVAGGLAPESLARTIRNILGRDHAQTAETTTILRFKAEREGLPPPMLEHPADLGNLERRLSARLEEIHRSREGGASAMTRHRLAVAVAMLLSNLCDPVSGPMVRHISLFVAEQLGPILRSDDRAAEDFCQVLEYALAQALDGLSQFQHDAYALGLAGRGGYSRLVEAVVCFTDDLFAEFDTGARRPLVTFGLTKGDLGSFHRYRVDVQFSVLFLPQRWRVLLHEVGHHVWESLFDFHREGPEWYRRVQDTLTINGIVEEVAIPAHFESARALLRELFPAKLTVEATFGGDCDAFVRAAIRGAATQGRHIHALRYVWRIAVQHALLRVMADADVASERARSALPAGRDGEPADRSDIACAKAWWAHWKGLAETPADALGRTIESLCREAVTAVREAVIAVEPELKRAGINVDEVILVVKEAAFLADVGRGVRVALIAEAARADDFLSAGDPDRDGLVLRQFGDILKVFDRIREEFTNVEAWKPARLRQHLEQGWVLADVPLAPTMTRLLEGVRPTATGPSADDARFLLSQFSLVLSFWHRQMTQTTAEIAGPLLGGSIPQSLSGPELLEALKMHRRLQIR